MEMPCHIAMLDMPSVMLDMLDMPSVTVAQDLQGPGHATVDAEKQAGAKTVKHVTNTCISPRKLIKGSPNPIIAMSQRLESYYSKVNVWNLIIAKRDVWSPIIANFSINTKGGKRHRALLSLSRSLSLHARQEERGGRGGERAARAERFLFTPAASAPPSLSRWFR
jgi:hypothetical protein